MALKFTQFNLSKVLFGPWMQGVEKARNVRLIVETFACSRQLCKDQFILNLTVVSNLARLMF